MEVTEFQAFHYEQFKITIQRSELTTDEEVNEEINDPPYFKGYEFQTQLPSIEVEVGIETYYPLPEVRDRDNDTVSIRFEAGSSLIESC